jgi:cytochrome c oxidase subunit IV
MTHEQQHHPAEQKHHIVGYGQFVVIWLGLLALTGITVSLAGIDLGRWIIVTALTIATIKTGLVLSVFMHLKFEDRVFRLFVLVAIVTFAIFITMTFFDYAFY